MITDEHFEALRELKQAYKDLGIACAELSGTSSFIHEAFDRGVTKVTPEERDILRKLRSVK